MPKQSYQKLILQISVLLLPEEDCYTYCPPLTESYKVLQVLQREKKVTRSVGRQSTIPFLLLLFFSPSSFHLLLFFFSSYSLSPLIIFLLLFFFSSYSFSPLICFLLLFFFSSYSFSPLIHFLPFLFISSHIPSPHCLEHVPSFKLQITSFALFTLSCFLLICQSL